jgi:hypothetical protein
MCGTLHLVRGNAFKHVVTTCTLSQKCIGFDMAADVLHRCQVGTSVAYGAYGTHQLPQITAAAHTRARGIQGVKLQACFVKEMLMA